MPNQYLTKGLTGKSTRKQVEHKSTAMQHGIIPVAQLALKADVVNDTTKSGKQVGACIVSSTHVVYISTGSSEVAPWNTIANGTAVTPA
jgi:hypothetical protein